MFFSSKEYNVETKILKKNLKEEEEEFEEINGVYQVFPKKVCFVIKVDENMKAYIGELAIEDDQSKKIIEKKMFENNIIYFKVDFYNVNKYFHFTLTVRDDKNNLVDELTSSRFRKLSKNPNPKKHKIKKFSIDMIEKPRLTKKKDGIESNAKKILDTQEKIGEE